MKVYNQSYSTLAKAAASAAFDNIVIAAGQSYFLQVPFPYEGVLEKIRCKQASGPSVAFTVDVYESDLGITKFGSAVHSIPAWAPLFEVVNQMSATAGNVVRELTSGIDATFRNVDGTQTVPQRFLYVHIAPTAAADVTEWMLSLEARTHVGG